MPLPLPRLDRRTFTELVDEGRGQLPLLAPGWTDHNASDPGITLLELLASVVETTSYRLDRTPPAVQRAFLRLVGIEPRPAQVARTVLGVVGPEADLPAGLAVTDATGTVTFRTTRPLAVSPAQLVAVRLGGIEASPHDVPDVPALGDAVHLDFDAPLGAPGTPVALFVWTGSDDLDLGLRAELVTEWRAALVDPACPPGVRPVIPHWSYHHGVRTVWEYADHGGEWRALPRLVDRTRALSMSGFVRFRVPEPPGPGRLRCRLVCGHYERPPRIRAVVHNAVPARHAVDAVEERAGRSTGAAGQRFAVSRPGVVPRSTRLRVDADDGRWSEVLDWDRTGPHDRHYLLVPETGEIEFGDGRSGRIPASDRAVHVRYQVGGGPAGNVPAATLTRWTPPVHTVTHPVPAACGAPAERLDDAQGRALDALAARDRAVTLPDFEAVARATPGVPVAAALALAEHHPALPCVPAAGCVTVVAVPTGPRALPEASPAFLAAVRRHLDRRRSLTTELHVVGPRFTTVEVTARLWVVDAPEDPAAAAREALDTYFHPFDGGPAGTGWPVGRDVHRSAVQALLSSLVGVVGVDRLALRTATDPTWLCGNLPICPDSLLVSGTHHIDVVPGSAP